MSAFHTKFGVNDVLPNELPKYATFRPSNYVSNLVGGKKMRKTCKTRKTRKNWKKMKMQKHKKGGKTWKKTGGQCGWKL